MNPVLSIIITAHGNAPQLTGMINCLACQRVNTVVPHSRTGEPVHYGQGQFVESQREYIVTWDGEPEQDLTYFVGSEKVQKIINDKEAGVGHHTREPGIKAATGDFIVLTNCDNYFVSGWMDQVVTHMQPGVGFIYWNGVNNLWRWSSLGGSRLVRGGIDLSFCAVKSEIAKEVGFKGRDYEADWTYINSCLKLCREQKLKVEHINQILSVHN